MTYHFFDDVGVTCDDRIGWWVDMAARPSANRMVAAAGENGMRTGRRAGVCGIGVLKSRAPKATR